MSSGVFKDNLFSTGKVRVTKQRAAIIEILNHGGKPVTAEEIYNQLKDRFKSLALSTIYRNLEILTLNGIVNKISIMNDDRARFEINNSEHQHHVVCIDCKQMIVIDECPFGKFEQDLTDKLDFLITSHRFEIYGYCSSCRK